MAMASHGCYLLMGTAQGALLFSQTGLSFWGGVDADSGDVIDHHHPLYGRSLAGNVLAIPGGRGSCTGSSVLLELILNGRAPAALLLCEADEILVLGALVAWRLFQRRLPIALLDEETFNRLAACRHVRLDDDILYGFGADDDQTLAVALAQPSLTAESALTAEDRAMLAGDRGVAPRQAMRIVVDMARLQQADKLVSVSQAHIDGCIYTGRASLDFAKLWVAWGARVRVPTTLNAVSVDCRRWRAQGVPAAEGEPAEQLAQAYLQLGAAGSFTCAPYLLPGAPQAGEHIAWSESNAVAFANSVLAARTQKYPDFLDLCIAITGRAPCSGPHLSAARQARARVDVILPDGADDAVYPLLGHLIGELSPRHIPAICGLERSGMDRDDLKAFSAAFATTSAAPMFHIVGITPEAATLEAASGGETLPRLRQLDAAALLAGWRSLNTAQRSEVQLVALGNPHLSLTEFARLAKLCRGRRKHPQVDVVLTSGRDIWRQAREAGYVAQLEAFGARCINDTCWCMLRQPVIAPRVITLMTNSGKYAHYAPGLVGRAVRFASLADCVVAACEGRASLTPPPWLMSDVEPQEAR